jgi:hypothetical protein
MKFSNILAVVLSTASIAQAAAVGQRDAALEVRGCNYDSCDACHNRDQYCVHCDTGGGIGVSCAVWFVYPDPRLVILRSTSNQKFL